MIPGFRVLRRHVGWSTVATIALIALAAPLGRVGWQDMAIERRLDALARQGYPSNVVELEAWQPGGPRDRTAVALYHHAFAMLRPPAASRYEDAVMLGASQPMPAEMRARFDHDLRQQHETLGYLHAAAQCAPTGFHARVNRDGTVRRRYHEAAARAAWLLCMEAQLAAERGDREQAGASLLAVAHLGHALSADATAEAYFARYRAWSSLCDSIDRVLARVELEPPVQAELARRLADADSRAHLKAVLVGERVRAVASLGNTRPPAALGSGASGERIVAALDAFAVLLDRVADTPDARLVERFGEVPMPHISHGPMAMAHQNLVSRLRVARCVLLRDPDAATRAVDAHNGKPLIVERGDDVWTIRCPHGRGFAMRGRYDR